MTDDLSIPSFLDRTDTATVEPVSAPTSDKARPSWRKKLKIHPAADMLPHMSETEFEDLKDDIEKNGLQAPIVLYQDQLLDGRHRLDALEQLGLLWLCGEGRIDWMGRRSHDCWNLVLNLGNGSNPPDPYDLVLSLNIHRRHLTAEQKRDLIAKVLKAKPEQSNRQIAKQTNTSPTTVGKIREEAEAAGDVSKLDTRTDTKGRKQASAKPKKSTAPSPRPEPVEVAATQPAGADMVDHVLSLIDAMDDNQRLLMFDKLEVAYGPFIIERGRELDAERKWCAAEAKNPQKALDDSRKQQQSDDMDDDRREAKREARESGESWSDIKDEWEADWLRDNWSDDREQEFLAGFKADWQRSHRQEFPNSDFAPTSKAN
jgi:hypothetical protein